MGKKDAPQFETPNYEALTDLDDIDAEIEKHKDHLVGKDIVESRMKQDKKDYMAALNEQLSELKEEREHEIAVISALQQHKQFIAAGGTVASNVIPMKVAQN